VKQAKALLVVAICMCAVAVAATPAFAHYWPVFGFSSPGLGIPAASLDDLNYTTNYTWPLPGTYEWGSQPFSPALPVIPGISFDGNNTHHGSINFGMFGYGSPGLSRPGSPAKVGGYLGK
jgi:hypothetical protein